MDLGQIAERYRVDHRLNECTDYLKIHKRARIQLKGLWGSSPAFVFHALQTLSGSSLVIVMPDREAAAYLLNDLENIRRESELSVNKRTVLFFPVSFRRNSDFVTTDTNQVMLRAEVLNKMRVQRTPCIVLTWPDALLEKVAAPSFFDKNTLRLRKGETYSVDFITELLTTYGFERVDFVSSPGEFAVRGGIVDVFSFSDEHPYRIEFAGDVADSLRTFDASTQLSIRQLEHLKIVPDIKNESLSGTRIPITSYFPENTLWCFDDFTTSADSLSRLYDRAGAYLQQNDADGTGYEAAELFCPPQVFLKEISGFSIAEFGTSTAFEPGFGCVFSTSPQTSFNKNFSLLISQLNTHSADGFENIIFSDSPSQSERIHRILQDAAAGSGKIPQYTLVKQSLHQGFSDHDLKICLFTDHQIFDRYHRFRLKDNYKAREAITLKEIYNLQPGDYVTHIDHGVGRYAGLEKIDVNGKPQEAIRLVYGENDLLYVSIHSLHRISKYVSRDGTPPRLNRLGSNAWNKLKSKTKEKVKDIARDLIKLYAERRASEGHAFPPDNYLQHELEASFIYQDTPDQVKATADVKKDMEASFPMDRLICGDVGFGKTEIAVRAAFKAVCDSRQVAVLVPTTILALQHFKTFTDRLKDFPCTIEYLNRFRSAAEIKETLRRLREGKVDILIGTHRILSNDVVFKDIGLLIIDEEQKFGVAGKEKLRKLRTGVDTLTLTATPIPRTLQFSLMGARDLSVIQTPPPNRHPIQTSLHVFNEDVIRDSVMYEISRGGQVFFVHNRVQNLNDLAELIRRLCPGLRIATGHGQMEGSELEEVMLDFIEGQTDVLVSTTIIESGLDIPNVNTILINDAQNYGLSDLHQLRGRVGRANRKAFCYLLAPPLSLLTDDARKRLRTIEEFSELGSGFNIAMRDLDIRGAGNILGAEQSGFISEIGFEMYQKILDEALHELKHSEFANQGETAEKSEPESWVRDCQIETDLEILIPDHYVNNTSERMILYKELDNIGTEERLHAFLDMLADRFGPVPVQVQELLNALRLRWAATSLGIEKLVLREKKLRAYLVSNPESGYYQSATFGQLLGFIKENPSFCRLREFNNKLAMVTEPVTSIHQALLWIHRPGMIRNA